MRIGYWWQTWNILSYFDNAEKEKCSDLVDRVSLVITCFTWLVAISDTGSMLSRDSTSRLPGQPRARRIWMEHFMQLRQNQKWSLIKALGWNSYVFTSGLCSILGKGCCSECWFSRQQTHITWKVSIIRPHSFSPLGFVLFYGLSIFTDPSARAGYDTRSIFEAEFNRFELRVFLLLD